MRAVLWSFDETTVNIVDRDVSVMAVHALSGTNVKVTFRLTQDQLKGSPKKLRKRIEVLATDRLLDLASYLEGTDRNGSLTNL